MKNDSSHDLSELGFTAYNGPVPFEELEFPDEPDHPDYHWALNSAEIKQEYSGKVIAVHNRTVWGAGTSYRQAWDDAKTKPGCPVEELVVVFIS